MINSEVRACPSLVVSLVLAVLCTGAAASNSAIVSCEPQRGISSICGLHAPEDMVLTPDGEGIVFGQMAGPGGLFVLDPRNDQVQPLFEGAVSEPSELWGEASCTEPPAALLIHGIDVQQRAGGQWQLLAVNHAERESVEFFHLDQAANSWRATWRGCAVAPDDASFNDVTALPGEGFLVTNMASRKRPMWSAFLALLGFDTGLVYRWRQQDGFVELPSTKGRFPNGIIMSPDGNSFFVNMYFGNKVKKYTYPGIELLGEVSLSKPDNASWNESGNLLVASQHASFLKLAQSLKPEQLAPSLLPYSIVEIDPESLQQRQLLFHEGSPMGAGTVAIQRGKVLYVGSYTGDRIVRVPLSDR